MELKSKPIVSLCIPTNGVVEWIFPVFDSIYSQGCNNELFEVVVTDNGNNIEFKEKIKIYLQKYSNMIYKETDALPFINEIESYKLANGELIKFVNHRTCFISGALQRLIDYAKNNINDKPVTYFSNGAIRELNNKEYLYDSFDDFVRNLSYWSSWSTGMTIWKSDFDKLPKDVNAYNELFPHTTVLFKERNRTKYVINNTIIFDELPQGKKPKGNYDLFNAFGVEYPGIICDLVREGSITSESYRYIAKQNLGFIAKLYFDYFIRKDYCSYDLTGLENMYGIFYSKSELFIAVVSYVIKGFFRKIMKR